MKDLRSIRRNAGAPVRCRDRAASPWPSEQHARAFRVMAQAAQVFALAIEGRPRGIGTDEHVQFQAVGVEPHPRFGRAAVPVDAPQRLFACFGQGRNRAEADGHEAAILHLRGGDGIRQGVCVLKIQKSASRRIQIPASKRLQHMDLTLIASAANVGWKAGPGVLVTRRPTPNRQSVVADRTAACILSGAVHPADPPSQSQEATMSTTRTTKTTTRTRRASAALLTSPRLQ